MDIRPLTPHYAVAPQIGPSDLSRLRAEGYSCVICNRPDAENPGPMQMASMAEAAREAGLGFVYNPVTPGAITDENARIQRETCDKAAGPVLAYCASGNRSSIVWALSRARDEPAEALIRTAGRFGYDLEPFRTRIEALARG